MRGVIAAAVACAALLTFAGAVEGGPPSGPSQTGPKLKDPHGPAGPSAPAGSDGRLPSEVDTTFGAAAGVRIVSFFGDDLPVQGAGNVVYARLEASVFSVLLGVQNPGNYFYWATELLNSLAASVGDVSGFEFFVLTPTLGVHGALVEDDVLLGGTTGLTGLRVMTCVPICMRLDWRIPTFDFMYNMTREADFDRSAAVSWGTAFEFAALF